MPRSSAFFSAAVLSGALALGGALGAGCKGPGLQLNNGTLAVGDPTQNTSFNLGDVCLGFSNSLTLDLTSAANSGVSLESITVTGGTGFSVTQPATQDIPAGGSVPFTVTYTPPAGANGPQPGQLTLTSTGSTNPTLVITLTANVISAPVNAVFSATCGTGGQKCSDLIFSGTPVDSSDSQTITVSNLGCPPLDLSAILDAGNPAFSLTGPASPVLLNQQVPVTVTFSPSAIGATTDAVVFSSAYPDAGLPYGVSLLAQGIAPEISINPPGYNFPAKPGVPDCETFVVTNTGSQPVTLDAPVIADQSVNGIFTLDAGWATGFVLDAGASVDCVVCVDFSDAGTYGAQLQVPFGTHDATAQLNTAAFGTLCATPSVVQLPDDDIFCGFETGSFQLATCPGSDGGGPVTITAIIWADGGNPGKIGTITGISPDGGPWIVSPGDPPITVNVQIHDNGQLKFAFPTVAVYSDATNEPILPVEIEPVLHAVPREQGAPEEDGGGSGSMFNFDTIGYYILGNDSGAVDWEFLWYAIGPDGDPSQNVWFDAGSNGEMFFTPQAVGSYKICLAEIEVDGGGFGNCGFDAGGPGADNTLQFCSPSIQVNN